MRSRVLIVVAVVGLIAAGCGSDNKEAARPDSNREIVVDMDEFSFGPDLIEVHPGETITFVLLNSGDNDHEFMVGRDVVETDLGYPNGFEHDFFETITPVVDPPSAGMNMGEMDMGEMDMTGDEHTEDEMDMTDDEHAEEEMSAEEMDMTEEEHADMDMGDEEMSAEEMDMTEEEHADMDMTGDEHAEEEMDMGGMDMTGGHEGHTGFMVERRPGEVARITITIPEGVLGMWEIGCFRGRGSHWDAGMRGQLLVTEA